MIIHQKPFLTQQGIITFFLRFLYKVFTMFFEKEKKGVEKMFHIVLVEPEIPQNTGNISRTCAVTGASLHLIRPLGFSIDDKHLKRAGLDYWHSLDLHVYDRLSDLYEAYPHGRFHYASTHAAHHYADVQYQAGDFLVFGKETAGLPINLLFEHSDECIRIPMRAQQRSLNLSNSVAIVLYEALRQNAFGDLR